MRTEWASHENLQHVFAALTPENALAAKVSLATGLRIGDVLAIRTEQIKQSGGRFTIKEEKTGKSRAVRLPAELLDQCLKICGRYYVFENRLNVKKHRTRQAVYKDLKRAAKLFRLRENLACHSLRKAYAVDLYKRTGGDLEKVKQLLNHSSEAVTVIYALADCLDKNACCDMILTTSRKEDTVSIIQNGHFVSGARKGHRDNCDLCNYTK